VVHGTVGIRAGDTPEGAGGWRGLVGAGCGSVASHPVESALPAELAAQRPDLLLPLQPDQGPQRLLDDGAPGLDAGAAHASGHQIVVEHDVRPHAALPIPGVPNPHSPRRVAGQAAAPKRFHVSWLGWGVAIGFAASWLHCAAQSRCG
jgi:hypothetical protein